MARFFRITGLFIALVFSFGYVLPDRAHVEREIVIAAPAEEVFALVSDFHRSERWSPLGAFDPQAEHRVLGEGVGQRAELAGGHLGALGLAQELVAVAEPARIVSRVSLADMGAADAAFTLTPEGEDMVRVVLSFDSNMRDGVPLWLQPVAVYAGYFAESALGPSYEQGLAELKRAAEKD
jgi:uncharacterized protein YndB with AHSA1/START domain